MCRYTSSVLQAAVQSVSRLFLVKIIESSPGCIHYTLFYLKFVFFMPTDASVSDTPPPTGSAPSTSVVLSSRRKNNVAHLWIVSRDDVNTLGEREDEHGWMNGRRRQQAQVEFGPLLRFTCRNLWFSSDLDSS